MNRILRTIAFAVLACGACGVDDPHQVTIDDSPESDDVPTGAARVVEVIDGDTIDVRLDGVTHRIRLIGINAPEDGECFADQAADALADLIDGENVELVADTTDRDAYDRLLRYVEIDGVDVGVHLVTEGFALARRYGPDTARAAIYEQAQSEAATDGRGLWARDACGSDPSRGSGSLAIGATRFDADGPDAENLNGEWIRIDNVGDSTADLTGWTIRDESSSNRYSFPDGFELQAGRSVTLRTGCGDDTDTDLHWCKTGSAVWNNDGDTAFLLDPAGNIVDTWRG